MNAQLWVSIVLGLGALSTAVFSIYTQTRDRGRHVAKQEGEIQIDEATEQRIAAEAAQINSGVAIAQQNWWKAQFDAVKIELIEEQKQRRRLSTWADEHQKWDQRAWTLALQADPTYPPPPKLDTTDD